MICTGSVEHFLIPIQPHVSCHERIKLIWKGKRRIIYSEFRNSRKNILHFPGGSGGMMNTGTILIVEDEGLIALHLMELLAKAGYSTPEPLSSGEELLDQLRKNPLPDLILMDIGLGGKMDGIETAQEVRKQYSVPIVFLTAYSDQVRKKEAGKITPYDYLTKPVKQEDLLDAIRTVMADLSR
jgi:two-component system, response regulator PdtaR